MGLQELTDEQEYEAELSQCVGVTAYHRWFFMSAFAEALGLRMRAFAVESGGERLGVIPLLLRRRGPVSTVNQVPVTCVGPVMRGETLRSGRVDEMLRVAEPVLRAERAVVTKWSFTPGLDVDISPLASRGFELASVENFIIPGTKSIEDYLKGLAPKQRAAIRRGGLRGLTTGPSTRQEITEWFPGLASGEQSRQGRVSEYTLAAATRLAERLADDPRLLWRSVRGADGQTLVMNVSIIDTDRLWGWLLVGDPVPGPSPHVAGMWDAIEWSLSRNLTCDFGGATSSGNRDFKVAMGGEVETVAVAERIRPRVYEKLRTVHSRLSEFRAARTR